MQRRFLSCLALASILTLAVSPGKTDPGALFKAINAGNAPLVSNLLNHGADPNEADRDGNIPLIAACGKRDAKIISILLLHRASPEVRRELK